MYQSLVAALLAKRPQMIAAYKSTWGIKTCRSSLVIISTREQSIQRRMPQALLWQDRINW